MYTVSDLLVTDLFAFAAAENSYYGIHLSHLIFCCGVMGTVGRNYYILLGTSLCSYQWD